MKYEFTALVKRVVLDEIVMSVEADSELEALDIAEEVLDLYPLDAENPECSKCLVVKRQYIESEIIDIDETEDAGAG